MLGRRRARGWVYVLPALLVYFGFAIWPALNTIRLSFLKWDGILAPTWAGFSNYTRIFQDPTLYEAILHSLVLIVFFSFVPVLVGLLMTGLLLGKVRRGMTAFRVIFFLPQVLPLVAVGITWRWLYSEDGVINQLLAIVGLPGRAWLGDYNLALIALGLIGTWVMSGLCMMLFLSGAQKIDTPCTRRPRSTAPDRSARSGTSRCPASAKRSRSPASSPRSPPWPASTWSSSRRTAARPARRTSPACSCTGWPSTKAESVTPAHWPSY
jgi:hypothetical protein